MPFRYMLRCLGCSLEYSAVPESILVGPIGERIFVGPIPGVTLDAPIQYLETVDAYTGAVTNVHCPYCLLRVAVAVDLPGHELMLYVDRLDIGLRALFNICEQSAQLRAFPLPCPRCNRTIKESNAFKQCVRCDGRQVQTRRSQYFAD